MSRNSTPYPREAFEGLVTKILHEHMRAMDQRDEFKRTGVSTAAEGKAYDTAFGAIIHGFMQSFLQSLFTNLTAEARVTTKLTIDKVLEIVAVRCDDIASEGQNGGQYREGRIGLAVQLAREFRLMKGLP